MPQEEKKQVRRCLRADGLTEVFVEMTFSEWMDRIWSDGVSSRWRICLDGDPNAYYVGIVEPKKVLHCPGNYPMASSALGVYPDDVPNRMAFDKAKGVPTEYNSEGDPVMRDKKHRREYCRAHGVHDRNAGFSDPVPD